MSKTRKAFTFVEIMVVALLIGMMAVFVVPRLAGGLGKAKHQLARPKMAIIEGAIGEFTLHCERRPTQGEGLEALLTAPDELSESWDGPYLKRSGLLDPWKRQYIYVAEGQVNIGDFDLVSFGADGEPGGEGENADIYND